MNTPPVNGQGGTLAVEWGSGETSFWGDLTDAELDRITAWVEANIRTADSVGG